MTEETDNIAYPLNNDQIPLQPQNNVIQTEEEDVPQDQDVQQFNEQQQQQYQQFPVDQQQAPQQYNPVQPQQQLQQQIPLQPQQQQFQVPITPQQRYIPQQRSQSVHRVVTTPSVQCAKGGYINIPQQMVPQQQQKIVSRPTSIQPARSLSVQSFQPQQQVIGRQTFAQPIPSMASTSSSFCRSGSKTFYTVRQQPLQQTLQPQQVYQPQKLVLQAPQLNETKQFSQTQVQRGRQPFQQTQQQPFNLTLQKPAFNPNLTQKQSNQDFLRTSKYTAQQNNQYGQLGTNDTIKLGGNSVNQTHRSGQRSISAQSYKQPIYQNLQTTQRPLVSPLKVPPVQFGQVSKVIQTPQTLTTSRHPTQNSQVFLPVQSQVGNRGTFRAQPQNLNSSIKRAPSRSISKDSQIYNSQIKRSVIKSPYSKNLQSSTISSSVIRQPHFLQQSKKSPQKPSHILNTISNKDEQQNYYVKQQPKRAESKLKNFLDTLL